ncbi:hypothetical protein [Halostreptopolyspora alba]|uniref:Uncharacterized protein n=1 Tax=Halostreptopolyspora alba TaxID=2487137 RepID=A0A3N0E6U8_9ACTN|nr:hypothetical protein EFW17_15005 [Nocardiopsaceae bacterium YIM 96095]
MVYEGEPAVQRLRDLGLTIEDLTYALATGDREARRYRTDHDPPIMSGLARWAGTVRGLRDRLVPSGWHVKNSANLPVTLSPDEALGIVAVTGNENTGIRGPHSPCTQRPRGVVTLQAIERNRDQFEKQLGLPLEGLDVPLEDMTQDLGSFILWILLYHEHQDKIWAELSLPISIHEERHVGRWHERILLPTATPDG